MGFRTHDEDGALDTMSLDEFLIENKEATFLLRMKGRAMEQSGILDGDLLIIDRSRDPKPQDIVAVVLDGAFGIKRVRDLPNTCAKVEAVVTGVIRKYA